MLEWEEFLFLLRMVVYLYNDVHRIIRHLIKKITLT